MKTIIHNATIVTMNPQRDILHGDVLIEDSRITKVGRIGPQDAPRARRIDASGLTIIPGFVQTHIHLCQTLFRNLADDLELLDWLKLRIWPFEAAHDRRSIALSARLGIAELIKSGTTTIMDMETVHHTDRVLEEIESSGIRAVCGKAMMDECPGAPKGLIESTQDSIKASLALWKNWHLRAGGRIQVAFAPRFVLSCSDRLFHELQELAGHHQLIVHTHAAENRHELEAVHQRFGMANIEYFHSIRLTGDRLCLAHCIWLNANEYDILRDTGTRVLHCPSSNLKLGSGIAQVPEMLAKGINVSMGADGAPCNNNLDMFKEMRLAALIQKPRLGPGSLTARQVFEMATLGGARALHLQADIGSIEPGKKADLSLVDLRKTHSMPADDVYSQIVYSACAEDVRTVLVDGVVVMKDRNLKTIDEERLIRSIQPEVKRLLRRVDTQ